MAQHLAGIVVTKWNNYSLNTVLAGCGRAPTFGRMAVYEVLRSAHAAWSLAGPRIHIDDIQQGMRGQTADVANTLGPAAAHVAAAFQPEAFASHPNQ